MKKSSRSWRAAALAAAFVLFAAGAAGAVIPLAANIQPRNLTATPDPALAGSENIDIVFNVYNFGPNTALFDLEFRDWSDNGDGGNVQDIYTTVSNQGWIYGGTPHATIYDLSLMAGQTGTVEFIASAPEKGGTAHYEVTLIMDPSVAEAETADNTQTHAFTILGPALDLSIPQTPSQFMVGSAAVGSSVSREAVLYNLGTTDLLVSDLLLAQGDTENFALNLQGGSHPCMAASFTVAAAGSVTFTVVYSPLTSPVGNSLRAAILEVVSNDRAEPNLNRYVLATTPVEEPAGGGGGGGCFIATAAYGEGSGEVEALRGFRDRVLLRLPGGEALVGLYYRLSPPLASAIRGNKPARAAVRAGLAPVVFAVRQPGWAVGIIFLAVLSAAATLVLRRNRRGRIAP